MKAAIFRFLYPGHAPIRLDNLTAFLDLADQLAGGARGALDKETPRRTEKKRLRYWALRSGLLG